MLFKNITLRASILWALTSVLSPAQAAPTEIKMPTPKGYVAFTVEGQWPVLALQQHYPVASAAFRIPDGAPDDSPDSSNIVLAFYDLQTSEGRTAFATPPKRYGTKALVGKKQGAWNVYRQLGQQGDMPYTIVDAKQSGLAGVGVSVRMVWPHRKDAPSDLDMTMERVLQEVLQSVKPGVRGPLR